MKKLILILPFFILNTIDCFGQEINSITKQRQQQINELVSLIKNDRVTELSNKIQYPIKRPNPIPDIKNKEQFILYYQTILDDNFKKRITSTEFDSTNTIDKYNGFGLFSGDIWLDEEGKIITINYSSPKENQLLKMIHKETVQKVHNTIKPWKENILVCDTNNFLVRIDRMANDDLRYVSWNKPKAIKEKPDLMLFKGTYEVQGTMGDVNYIFKNQNWTYEIARVEVSESLEDMGLFLRVYNNDVIKTNQRCTEIK